MNKPKSTQFPEISEPTSLHIPNYADALQLDGEGVTGRLKDKARHLLARAAAYPVDGDRIILPESVCPKFLEASRFVRETNHEIIKGPFNTDPEKPFKTIEWTQAIANNSRDNELLDPFILTPPIYQISRETGMKIRGIQNETLAQKIVADINDKALFVERCNRLSIPVPKNTYIINDKNFSIIQNLLELNEKVMMRKALCGGGLGNLIISKTTSGYALEEIGKSGLSWIEANETLLEWMSETTDPLVVAPFATQIASYTNLIYVPADAPPSIISTNQQIFDQNTKYIGFQTMNSHHKIRSEEHALRFAQELQSAGYTNAFFDLDSFVPASAPDEIWYVECNGRKNGNMHTLAYMTSIIGHKNDRTLRVLEQTPSTPAVVSLDVVAFAAGSTFEDVLTILKKEGILYGFNRPDDGIIVTIPPANDGIMGLASFGKNLEVAQDFMRKTLSLLDKNK